jgi:hypothetical protein
MMPKAQSAATPHLRKGALRLLLSVGAAILLGGCMAAQKRPEVAWKTAALIRPNIPSPLSPDESSLPEVTSIPLELSPLPSFVPWRVVPPKPRVPSQPPSAGENGKQDGPLIVPQITAQESASAQQEITASLGVAERNLEAVRGKNLNSVQNDMFNKVKGFMSDAREAAHAGDWARARSVAKKAQLLSEELARSL